MVLRADYCYAGVPLGLRWSLTRGTRCLTGCLNVNVTYIFSLMLDVFRFSERGDGILTKAGGYV